MAGEATTSGNNDGVFSVINNAINKAGDTVSHYYDLQAAKAGAKAVASSPMTYVVLGGIALVIVVIAMRK